MHSARTEQAIGRGSPAAAGQRRLSTAALMRLSPSIWQQIPGTERLREFVDQGEPVEVRAVTPTNVISIVAGAQRSADDLAHEVIDLELATVLTGRSPYPAGETFDPNDETSLLRDFADTGRVGCLIGFALTSGHRPATRLRRSAAFDQKQPTVLVEDQCAGSPNDHG